jgi:heme a synthase
MAIATSKPARGTGDGRLPTRVTPLIRVAAWTMLIAQSAIVLTGAVVRLTGSGLGCPTWPKCTDESLVNTPEMGVHGIIEFGNRLLGVGLGVLGVATIILLWRLRRSRPDLFWLAVGLTAVVPVQAVIGGISVLTQLNPWIVAAHFVPSAIAVAVSAYFVRRTYDSGRNTQAVSSSALRALSWVIGGLMVVVVVLGVLTTGAGPHAGDELSARNGFDTLLISRLHAVPVWLLVITTVIARVLAARERLPQLARALDVLLIIEGLQGIIGYVQFFSGLPIVLVALHLIGACATIAAATAVVDANYRRDPLPQG